jgi:pimeloyl-ACP methyl ester carboxylesterase
MNSGPDLPTPDQVLSLRCARSDNTGKASVYLARARSGSGSRGRGALRRPVLVAEGFPGGHTQAYLLRVLRQHGLMDRLQARGYDIAVIGFDRGSDRIQNNAGVIEDAIDQLRRAAREPLVVCGLSMGGLVVRYALTRMEHERRDHHTRAMLTWDTPHRGAYTSLAVQWFVHQFKDRSPVLAAKARELDSPANQQLMRLWLRGGEPVESPLRRELLEELQGLGGYPQQPRRWAIASGQGGGGASFAAHREVFDWSADDGRTAARLFTLGEGGRSELIAEGRCAGQDCVALRCASALSWEAVPGGQGEHFKQAAAIAGQIGGRALDLELPGYCTVPTFSALDLDPGADPLAPVERLLAVQPIPFHDWSVQKRNLTHLDIGPETGDWLIERLEHFDPHDPGFLRDPQPF